MASTSTSVSSSHTRNLCIVAHVDHGKSSFADSLLAANGIISSRLAGTIRYLDSREDEQERGITMESSAVSLRWRVPTSPSDGSEPVLEDYRINLIDTPGHVDFSSEVSTASRLCDGALVLVDAVEGVCTQTITVLRQTHLSHLRPLLVINKVDRLITELKLSPSEAYHHLARIIEDVNAIVGSFYAGERMEDDWRWREKREVNSNDDLSGNVDEEYEERDDSNLYFDPSNGTVLFSSAIDGWAFRISRFAQLYASKLGMSEANLNRCLWGDWYLDPKSKRVVNRKKMEQSGKKLKPLFVQFVLENIWSVYDSIVLNNNPVKVDKIISSLGIKVRPQDLRSKDTRNLLLSVFSQWLPLAPSTFRAIIEKIPNPSTAQSTRMPKLLHPELGHSEDEVQPLNTLEKDLYEGSEADDRIRVAYISKMFAVKTDELPENQRKQLTADDMRAKAKVAREERDRKAKEDALGVEPDPSTSPNRENSLTETVEEDKEKKNETLVGFARLYSGTLKIGESVYAVLPKYNTALSPSHPLNGRHIQKVKIEQLYMMMGRELVAVKEVQSGNLFAIAGLEGVVLRNATICGMSNHAEAHATVQEIEKDSVCLVNLAGVNQNSAPIVRVALEPKDPSEMSRLVEGLRLLNQADPCVETLIQETGEHVILTAGELHLERCLKDLRDRFARIEITVSPPIVPFRETCVSSADMAPPKVPGGQRGTIVAQVQSGLISLSIRAIPLPENITTFLLSNAVTIKKLQRDRRLGKIEDDTEDLVTADANLGADTVKPDDFWHKLNDLFNSAGKEWTGMSEQVWTFGPKRIGANILFDRTEGSPRSLRHRLERQNAVPSSGTTNEQSPVSTPPLSKQRSTLNVETLSTTLEETQVDHDNFDHLGLPNVREMDESIDTAFQLSSNRGPLCAEPVVGLAYCLEKIDIVQGTLSLEQVRSKWSTARGSLISVASDAFKNALLDWSPRLQLAMYSCDIQATGEVLGKVYGVVAKRRGRIVSEEMKEGTAFFTISALLPVVESFGFADEIRTRTSGAASPQLVFHGYEVLNQDPFWVPTTEEELEDLGEKADRENIARKYMDTVRKRKGMAVERKVVEHSEKQKTMRNF